MHHSKSNIHRIVSINPGCRIEPRIQVCLFVLINLRQTMGFLRKYFVVFALLCWLGLVTSEEPTRSETVNRNPKQMLWTMQLPATIPNLPQQMGMSHPVNGIPLISPVRDFWASGEQEPFSYIPGPLSSVYEWPPPPLDHHHHHQTTYCPKCRKCPASPPKCPDPCPGTSVPASLETIKMTTIESCNSLSTDVSNFLKCSRVTAAPTGNFTIEFSEYLPRSMDTTKIGSTAIIGIVVTCPKRKIALTCKGIPEGYIIMTQNGIVSDGTAAKDISYSSAESFMQVQVSQNLIKGFISGAKITCTWETS